MYKCIHTEFGVDVSLNKSKYFQYNDLTHFVTDLGSNRVRITRKIDGIHELYDSPVSDFTDLNGIPVATTPAELSSYFATKIGAVKAGEGVAVNGNTVSVIAGGPATIGGYKVGTGLMVDGSGRLSASASSEVTKVIATEEEMLALAAEELRPYRVIRLDTKRLYYLNAGDSPAVLSNWFEGPSLETTVLSFKGRTGAIEPELGDYNFDIIELTDKSTSATHKFVIDGGNLYIENFTTAVRKQIAYAEDFDLADINSRLTSLDDLVNNPSTGLAKKVDDAVATTNQINNVVNNATTGLATRVGKLETTVVQQEDLILFVNSKVDSTAANTVVLDQRLSTTELDIRKKADLVAGKVPLNQLPDIPVGRKVNVANKAARLALPRYADLTIAYESDTGDAWGLDANANPAIEANWSKLGNAQAAGVLTFNGRTGNVAPQSGDYNTNQITETLTKEFVTPEQKAEWSAKETPTGAQAKADAAQTAATNAANTYADSTFIPLVQKGSGNGVAPLDSDSKVPLANLMMDVPNGIAPLGAAGKVPAANLLTNVAGGVPLLNASAKVQAQYIETGTASGVAPLGTASKVPMVHILTNTAGGVPLLDGNGKVSSAQLPSNLPSARPIWRNNKASRSVGTYTTHNSGAGNEMIVYVRTTGSTTQSRELRATVRESASGASFTFQSDAVDVAGQRWLHLYLHVPYGWQYTITSNGGSTNATIESWYEFY